MKHKLFNKNFFLALVGLGLIFFLCQKLGFKNLYTSFEMVGFKFVFILVLALAWHVCNTIAWGFLLPVSFSLKRASTPSFWTLFKIKLKAETYNMITPFFSSGGEPLRVYYLKNFYSLKENISSVSLDKILHICSGLIFVIVGTFAASFYFNNPFQMRLLLIPIILIFIFLSFFIFKNKKKFFLFSLFFHILGWILGVFEVYFLLYFLGHPISFFEAFALSAFMIVVHSLLSFIPGSLGVSEGSLYLLFSYLGLSPLLAVSFPLLRRLRMLCFTFIGVLMPINPHQGS